MRVIAPAKINLFLHVLRRREDGYHELNSLVAFTNGFGDVLEFELSDRLELVTRGKFASAVDSANNSILSAVQWFDETYGTTTKFRISVEKNIPAGGGLGGGTADAAATIHALAKVHNIDAISPSELVGLGADVPVSFFGKTCVMSGIGEIITPTSLGRDYGLILVNPNLEVSTKEIFRNLRAFDAEVAPRSVYTLDEIRSLHNTLETTAISLCPPIGEVLTALRSLDFELVRMTGSGATVFALTKVENLKTASQKVRELFPNYWVESAQISRSTT